MPGNGFFTRRVHYEAYGSGSVAFTKDGRDLTIGHDAAHGNAPDKLKHAFSVIRIHRRLLKTLWFEMSVATIRLLAASHSHRGFSPVDRCTYDFRTVSTVLEAFPKKTVENG